MNSSTSPFQFARFVSTAAALSMGVGISMGGIFVAVVAVIRMAGLE